MSTRCQVNIEGADVLVYRHSDGYPEGEHGVLASLLPFVAGFWKGRGHDPAYALARLLMHWGAEEAAHIAAMPADERKTYGYVRPQTLGYGVDTTYHWDLAYVYDVRADGTVRVYRPSADRTPETHRHYPKPGEAPDAAGSDAFVLDHTYKPFPIGAPPPPNLK